MNTDISALNPKRVWKHFSAICGLPHPSRHEEKVRAYIQEFAKKNHIECRVDEIGNVILRKPATPGMENRKGIILQAHMDMVPQKNSDKDFDFEKDPIQAYVDGEWVTADGTTLGSDNGMGLAAALAAFEDDSLEHGPLEALFTMNEESGMEGAFGLKPGLLQGDILMNLDSEDEGELYVGCAGGVDASASFDYKEEKTPADYKGFILEIKGLKGGHSGMEIILQRGNSNKLLFRFLKYASARLGLRLSSVEGGNMRNAIPREAVAVVAVPADKADELVKKVAEYYGIYRDELGAVEPDFTFKAVPAETPATVMDADTQGRLIRAVHACPNGVMRMSDDMPGLVETSTNLAIVASDPATHKINIKCLLRSSVNSAKADLGEMIKSVFELAGAHVEVVGGYDGWKPNMQSPILKSMQRSYQALFGREPAVKAIHAGLECGIISGPYPHLDMISFGPTIRFPHSPDEKVNIESVEKFWKFLIHTLKNAPVKEA